MTINTLELPHILESIAYSLRFNDLANCVRVNRTWYIAFTPLLWEDVIAYRSIPTDEYNVWTYQQYFLRDQCRQGFLKNAHHIRALTCQTPQFFTTLNTTHCVNLVEINLVTDRSCEAFPALTRLIARCPNLRAVSIESLQVYPEPRRWERVHDLVDMLCRRPEISCFYLEGIDPRARDLEFLCAKLLRRIRQDPKQIKKLTLQRRDLLTRSRRGPSQGRAWTARECPLVVPIPGKDRWRIIEDNTVGNNGRWENEQWTPMEPSHGDTLAVMETEGELQVVLPSTLSEAAYARFLDKFTNCQDVTIGNVEGRLLYALVAFLQRLPNINKFDKFDRHCSLFRSLGNSIYLPQSHGELTSLRLRCVDYSRLHTRPLWFHTLLNTSISTRLNSFVDLDLDGWDITITELMHVLSGTPSLQTIRITSVLISRADQELVPATWASNNLRRVSLGLYLKGHKKDINFHRNRELLSTEERACTTGIAIALAPIFLEQLNSQFELRELKLSFNNRLHPLLSPFLQLSLDPAHGLPRLSNLKKLEKLVITGLAHRLGQQEIVWMSQNWPRLRWIEVPIIDHWIDPTEAVSCTRHSVGVGQEMVAPEFDQWFPRLHVVIPIDCHSCGKCWDRHCPCRGFYEAGNINHEELLELEYEMIEADRLEGDCWEDEMEWRLTVELEYEAYLIDSFDDLYLGRHHQHRSGFWPNPKRR
ncbi:MAG: hypothetical protein BYD32DRAFT_437613 [Podila humilis]|nr:MAG: hypothetical protein BYD32DRAFT_437613 [Podila humilis]